MPCGWEGNRRSGIALATRHRLQWFIRLPTRGLRKGDKHPANTHPSSSLLTVHILNRFPDMMKAVLIVSFGDDSSNVAHTLYCRRGLSL